MPDGRIHIVARDIQRYDAVGNFCRQIYVFLRDRGFHVTLTAENCHPDDRSSISRPEEIIPTISVNDVTFFHFSTEDPAFSVLANLPNPKIVYFHNLTPESFFTGIDDHAAHLIRHGLEQRPLAAAFDVLMTNSSASRHILHAGLSPADRQRIPEASIVACPPIIGVDRWASVAEEATSADVDSRTVVQVGRLALHKGSVELLDGFIVLAERDPTVKMLFVGAMLAPSETLKLTERVSGLRLEIRQRIQFLQEISDGELKSIYRQSGVCATMSSHEGFGVPLVDAMVFDKPLVIRSEAGMNETVADAAISIENPTPGAIADALSLAIDNRERRAELAAARRVRLEQLRRLADGNLVLEAIRQARELHRPVEIRTN